MARLIFISFVIVAIALVWRGRDSAGGKASKRLLLLGFAALVVVTILMPQLTTLVADRIGIGRGADLVFYLTSFAVMFLAALVYLEFRRQDDCIATLTRALALREWDESLRNGQAGAASGQSTRPDPTDG